MINLRYQFNAVLTTLPEFGEVKHACVPVLRRDGSFVRVKWLEYIDLEEAQAREGAKAVSLDILQYSVAPGHWPKWRDVPEGMAIRGCLTPEGAYCVIEEGKPRLTAAP